MNEDLRKWFREKWVRMDTKGNIKGDCAREEGEGKPKCLPLAKAKAMDKKDRATSAQRKRREDPVADRSGKGGKPINVTTEEVSTSQLIKASHSKRGAPGTLKAKIKGPLTLSKVRALKNKPNATTLDKKQANFYINMQSEHHLHEASKPTNSELWSRAKALARSKFDVYPSAYANGWAAKWYKSKGGGWKSMNEQDKLYTKALGEAKATYPALPGQRTHIMNKDVRHPEHGIISNGTVLRHTGGSNFEVRAGRAKGKIISIPSEHVNKLNEGYEDHHKFPEYMQKILKKIEQSPEEKAMRAKKAAEARANAKPIAPQKAEPYKPLGGRDEKSGRSYSEAIEHGVAEAATPVAVRMQRALDKIKAERERSERRGKELMDQIRQKQQEQKPMKEQKTLNDILEELGAKLHPNALHVKPVKVDGQTKYQVHAVGKNLSSGIQKGEHLSDTELDDASEMGAKIKHIKEASWFGNNVKKNKSSSESITPGHEGLQKRGERTKGEGTEESVDHKARFAALIQAHSIREDEQKSALASIKKNIEGRFVSTDKDTDVIKDMDVDDIRKASAVSRTKHHRQTLKTFRTYKEDLDEAISSRQALSKAADFEYKAANTDNVSQEQTLKGKAKALRRAARLAQEVAGTVNMNISTTKS